MMKNYLTKATVSRDGVKMTAITKSSEGHQVCNINATRVMLVDFVCACSLRKYEYEHRFG